MADINYALALATSVCIASDKPMSKNLSWFDGMPAIIPCNEFEYASFQRLDTALTTRSTAPSFITSHVPSAHFEQLASCKGKRQRPKGSRLLILDLADNSVIATLSPALYSTIILVNVE